MSGGHAGPAAARLAETLAGTPLAGVFAERAAPFLERCGDDAAVGRCADGVLRGLARVLATRSDVAAFLGHRPALLERIAGAGTETLASRARELPARVAAAPADDLEAALDALRLLRREETCLAACLDLGGVVTFEATSIFLSELAEAITRRALELALARRAGARPISVLGLGKIAGREFTYHSDLDLIFLHGDGPERIAEASGVGQRLIAYLATMTGAGVAYAVDTRLRPSGGQGALVTSLERFEAYQNETAEIWEHVAVLRARAIAGEVPEAQAVLDRVRGRVLGRDPRPWAYLADLRERVVRERADESQGAIAFKTGAGGTMDVDFLAGGALLECGAERPPDVPSVPALLGAAVPAGAIEPLLADYRFLRRLEARVRWNAGRGVEVLEPDPAVRDTVAALLGDGHSGAELVERIEASRGRIRAAYRAVCEAGTIAALADRPESR